MEKTIKSLLALTLCALMLFAPLLPVFASGETKEVTVLFTHDLHSHFLPSAAEGGGEFGGYARLMTAIKEQKAKDPNAILVDGGDFSMGSLFQTAYPTSALELRIMGKMGYDATTFGNHEFDYLPAGLVSMLGAALESGEDLPAILEANYLPPKENEEGYDSDSAAVWEAFEKYGVKEYMILERGGVYYALFGLAGYDSDACAPNSGMILEDPAKAAARVVKAATEECLSVHGVEPIVIALSHSGTENGKGEDYELAKKVEGIDLIISGHTHTKFDAPVKVGNTYIVSAGEYGKYLGVVKLEYSAQGTELKSYELVPIDETVADDPEIAETVEEYKKNVEENYLADYNVSFDEVLVNNQYTFDSVKEVYASAHESTLGNLYSDAYKWAVENMIGKTVDLALTASGVIRETMPKGDITVSDVFNAASLGVGTEGELVAIYLTGADLRDVIELDASVYPLMNSAQLFCSGVRYSFNTNRMLFNKVDKAELYRKDGSVEKIDDDKLYLVVTGMYAGQMLGSVEKTSFGLIKITPRDSEGNPVAMDELVNYVVRDENGVALKEWYAIASYLKTMGGSMDEKYSAPDGRKVIYSSFAPADLLRNANIFTYVVIALILLVITAITLVTLAIVRKVKRKKAAKA